VRGRDVLGTRAVDVDHGRELDTGERRQNPGMMAAQMPHADNRDAERAIC